MTTRTQKIISALLISFAAIGGFQALIWIINLNQIAISFHVAFWIYAYLLFKITFLYDLHFKNPGSLSRAKIRHESLQFWLHRWTRILLSAFWERILHYRKWQFIRYWQNYLLLPGLIFWGTYSILFLNIGRWVVQEMIALFSALALIVCYWFLKEVFFRRKEIIDADAFRALSVVKIYTAFILFASCLGISHWFCLESRYLILGIFTLTFWLVYQALFQHHSINLKNIQLALLLSVVVTVICVLVNSYWSLNYLTAGIFLTAWYNFFWSMMHHHIHHKLSWEFFWDNFLIALAFSAMMLGVTDFKGKLINRC